MTEPTGDQTALGRVRSRGALGVVWTALAIFLIMVAVLAERVGTGQDPALRARAAATPTPPRRVLLRRIYERKVIVHLPPSASPQPTRASQQVNATGGLVTPVPITRSS
jgi:hypothetical protein